MSGEWLSVDLAARHLGITSRTVHGLLNRGELVGYKIGRVYRIRTEDIVAYLDSARIKPGDLDHLLPVYDGPRHVIDLRPMESNAS